MLKTIVEKMILFICFLFLLSIAVFWLARLAPGDPLTAYYGDSIERMSTEQKKAAAARLSLDKSIHIQYVSWFKNVLKGDFGISHRYKRNASEVVGKLWLNTLFLGGLSYILTFVFAIIIGLFCAHHAGKPIDRIIYRLGTIISIIPPFFIALLFILVFGVNLNILPTGGAYFTSGNGSFGDRVLHLIMPVTVMVLSHLWYYAYIIRNRVIEELKKDYIFLLRVKQLSTNRILIRHCLKNILPALITIMAISVPNIIMGTYIIEVVFSYPGLGTLIFESANYRDYNMLSLLTLITGFIIPVFSVSGQCLTEFTDSRMRYQPSFSAEVNDV